MNYEKSNKEKIKRILKHAVHIIGYISTFIVLCLSIVMGVQSCNGQENRQDKPIQQLNINNDYNDYKPIYESAYRVFSFTFGSDWFSYLNNTLTNLYGSHLISSNSFTTQAVSCVGRLNLYDYDPYFNFTRFYFSYYSQYNNFSINFEDNDSNQYYITINLTDGTYHSTLNNGDVYISDKLIYNLFFTDITLNSGSKDTMVLFYTTFYSAWTSRDNATLRPYMDLSNFKSGVYYSVFASTRTINYSNNVVVSSYLFGFYIDYDDTIYGIYNNEGKQVIGHVEYDSLNNPYFNYYRLTNYNDNTFPFSGVYVSYIIQTQKLQKYNNDIFLDCYYDVNNNLVINLDNTQLYFDWYQFQGWIMGCIQQGSNSPWYQTIGGNALYRMDLDFNYKIKGLDNFNLNKIMFGYNPSNGVGTINFVDSINTFHIYKYDNSFSLKDSGNYYLGGDYGLDTQFPYFITLDIYGGIQFQDFVILSYFTTPTTIKLSNINPVGGENMSNVFTLLHGTFSGVISALDFYVLPGITLITLMMIPLAIALVLAIIKVLRK